MKGVGSLAVTCRATHRKSHPPNRPTAYTVGPAPPSRLHRASLLAKDRPGGQGAALLFLAGDLPGEDAAVDVWGDDGEDQTLESGRLQRLHLPLRRAAGSKP